MGALKETSPDNLADREQRALAKLARIARCDAWHGGARAMVLAKRLARSSAPFEDCVTQAYHSSQGNATSYLAYECPECGTACMGQDAAYACCQPEQGWDENEATACDCGQPVAPWKNGMCDDCAEENNDKG